MENEQKNIDALLYLRVSTFYQKTEGLSLEQQKKKLLEYCKSKGYRVIDIYEDGGISGIKSDNRPAYLKMLEDAKSGRGNRIISWKLDRLSRSLGDVASLLDIVEEYDIALETLEENLDTKSVLGKFFIYIISLINYIEVENAKTRTIFNLDYAYELSHCSCCPIGFDKVDKKLVIKEEEAVVIRDIFNRCINGKSAYQISKELTEENVLNKKWHCSQVDNILKQKLYIGIMERHKNNPNKENVIYKDFCPKIISDEIWNEAQVQRKKASHSHYMTHIYLFKFKVNCPECDSILSGVTGRSKTKIKYLYYRCPNCRKKILYSEIKLEEAFIKKMDLILDYFALVDRSYITSTTTSYDDNIYKLQESIEKLEQRESKAKEMLLDGIIEHKDFSTTLENLKNDKIKLESELQQVITAKNNLYLIGSLKYEENNIDISRFKFISLYVCAKKLWFKLDKEQKRNLIFKYIDSIKFSQNEKKELIVEEIKIKENMIEGFGIKFRNDIFNYVYSEEKQKEELELFMNYNMKEFLANLYSYYKLEYRDIKEKLVNVNNFSLFEISKDYIVNL